MQVKDLTKLMDERDGLNAALVAARDAAVCRAAMTTVETTTVKSKLAEVCLQS